MSAQPPLSPEHLAVILQKCLSDERVTNVCLSLPYLTLRIKHDALLTFQNQAIISECNFLGQDFFTLLMDVCICSQYLVQHCL